MDGKRNDVSTLPASLEKADLFERIGAYQELGNVIHLDDIQWINRILNVFLFFGADRAQSPEEQIKFLSLCLVLNEQNYLGLSLEQTTSISGILKYLQSKDSVAEEIGSRADAVRTVTGGGDV